MSDIKRFEEKLDKIVDVQIKQEVNLAKLTESVEHHIKRTDLLEKQFEPVQEHISDLKSVIKILKIMGLIASIIEGFHYIGHL